MECEAFYLQSFGLEIHESITIDDKGNRKKKRTKLEDLQINEKEELKVEDNEEAGEGEKGGEKFERNKFCTSKVTAPN